MVLQVQIWDTVLKDITFIFCILHYINILICLFIITVFYHTILSSLLFKVYIRVVVNKRIFFLLLLELQVH